MEEDQLVNIRSNRESFYSGDSILSQTNNKLGRFISNNKDANEKICQQVVQCCLGYINIQGIEDETANHFLEVIDQIPENKFMCLILTKLRQSIDSKYKDANDILKQCFKESIHKFQNLGDRKKLMKKIMNKPSYLSQQAKDYIDNFTFGQSNQKDFKYLLSSFYEINYEKTQSNYQRQYVFSLDQQIQDQSINLMAATFLKSFLCFFIWIETLRKISLPQQQKRQGLQKRRNQFIDQLQYYDKDDPQYFQTELKPKEDEDNYDIRQVYKILRLFNYLFIVDVLSTKKSKKIIQYKQIKKKAKDDYKTGYNPYLLSKKGMDQTLFKHKYLDQNKGIDKEIAYYIGWQNKIKLIRDVIQGLLQLENFGILQTDLKFANKVQIGQHYYLIDFDFAYKLSYYDDSTNYTSAIAKYKYINNAYANLSKDEWRVKYDQYIGILFGTKYQSVANYAGEIMKNIKKYKLMQFLHFPLPPEKMTKQHSKWIKQRISKNHVLQLVHILTPIFALNPKNSDNRCYFKIEAIKELLKKGKQQEKVRMNMQQFYNKFTNIINDINFAHANSYEWSDSSNLHCDQCQLQKNRKQLIYFFIKEQRNYELCQSCGQKMEDKLTNSMILINTKALFHKKQKINLQIIANNFCYKKQKFNPLVFFQSTKIQILVLKYCIMVDIFSKPQCVTQKQVFYRLEYLVQKMMNQNPQRSLKEFLKFYIRYEGNFKVQQKYIKNKYNEYPFEGKFELRQNRDQINILYYNDRLLLKIYDQIINNFVQRYGRIYLAYKNSLVSLTYFCTMILSGQMPLDINWLRQKSLRLTNYFHQQINREQQQNYEIISKVLRQVKQGHISLLNTLCIKMAGKIHNIENKTQLQQKDILQQLQNLIKEELKQLRADKLEIIKTFQQSVINQRQFLQLFKFKKLVVQQTYSVNSKFNYKLLRKIFQENRQIEIRQTKIHNFSSVINIYRRGLVYFSLMNPQDKIQAVFKDHYENDVPIHIINFKGKQKDCSQFLQDQNGNIVQPIPQDGDEEYQDISESSGESGWEIENTNNSIFNKLLDLTIQTQAANLKILNLSNVTFAKQDCSKLYHLLDKSINLDFFGLKYCNQFYSYVLKALKPSITSIDLKNIEFISPIESLYLENKKKLKNLTIQQINFNSIITQIMNLNLEQLCSLKYLSLKWFTNWKKDEGYFFALQENPNLRFIQHLTLKTNSISQKAIKIISKMTSLKSLNLKCHFFKMPLSQLLFHISELKDLISLKINEQVQFKYHSTQDMTQEQLASIKQLNEYNQRKQPDSSDNSSCSLSVDSDSEDYDNIQQDKIKIDTCCDQELDQILKTIFTQFSKLKFLRLLLKIGKCFKTNIPSNLCKFQVWKKTIDEQTKQEKLRQGVIVYQLLCD